MSLRFLIIAAVALAIVLTLRGYHRQARELPGGEVGAVERKGPKMTLIALPARNITIVAAAPRLDPLFDYGEE